ncbi:hypothetical protein ABW20_dc0105864 [Dactylellina cionopaga]|nr:hypothetical protein ABW20_dc0105864 [Dactylellina cionopaga]
MSDAKQEILQFFQNPHNMDDSEQRGGQGASLNTGSEHTAHEDNTGPSSNLLQNQPDMKHSRSTSKSSFSKFHFKSLSKSKIQEAPASGPVLNIEVTSNPHLRPADRQSTMPDYLLPKKLKLRPEGPSPSEIRAKPSQFPPMPRFEVPGKLVYEAPISSELPQNKFRNESGYKFPSPTAENRRGQIRPFNPIIVNQSQKFDQDPQLRPLRLPQMQNSVPQNTAPQNRILRRFRPTSATTIASNGTNNHDERYDSGDSDDDNYSYRSRRHSDSRHSIDSYYTQQDPRPVSHRSEDSGWSYGPSHSSNNIFSGHVYANSPKTTSYSFNRKDKAVAQADSNLRTKNKIVNPFIAPRGGAHRREEQKTNGESPPQVPPKDWGVVPITIAPYQNFNVSAVNPASGANTPRPLLKGGGSSKGLPINPRPAREGKRSNRDWDMDLERDGNDQMRVGYV